MEAALVSVPTIASPTDAFQYAIRHGENGMLAQSGMEWQASLTSLSGSGQREPLAERAHQDALSQYTPEVRSQQLVSIMDQITGYFGKSFTWRQSADSAGQDHGKCNWPVSWESGPSLIKLGWYSLHSRGILTLLKQTLITVRRFLARWIPYSS